MTLLVNLPYSNQGSDAGVLTYYHVQNTTSSSFQDPTLAKEALDLSNEELLSNFVCHTYPKGSQWTPERLEVNGRSGRRAVCVVSRTKTCYSVLDLDSGLHGEGSNMERSEMSVEVASEPDVMA